MNEILQQRIEEKSKELGQMFFPDNMNVFARPNWEAGYIETACKEIANFALQNQWISVEESLPPVKIVYEKDEKWSDLVLIRTHKGGAYMDSYIFHKHTWTNNGDDVTHWMEIPSLEGGGE